MVTVVDASTFLMELAKGEALTERQLAAGDGDARSIADLLVDQVEFADVLLLNKTDLVTAEALGRVETVVKRLNPTARLLHAIRGEVDVKNLLHTGLFDPVAAAEAPGCDEEIADGHTPETEEYGISSLVFRSDRPFHPHRLADALDLLRGLLRSKGFCWIASRPKIAAIWSQAGPNLVIEPAQYWASTPIPPGQEISSSVCTSTKVRPDGSNTQIRCRHGGRCIPTSKRLYLPLSPNDHPKLHFDSAAAR